MHDRDYISNLHAGIRGPSDNAAAHPIRYSWCVSTIIIFECNTEIALIVYSMQYIHCRMSIYHFFPHCVYIGIQKLLSVVVAMKGSNYHAEVEMGSHKLPKSHSKSTTEPQYEEGGGGVSSSNFTIEESPAYQSVDVAVAQL